jgi:microprocessor complex subunit DGCR8
MNNNRDIECTLIGIILSQTQYFDKYRVEDEKVAGLCDKTSEPSPYAILIKCLQKNYGIGDTTIKSDLKAMRNKRSEFTLTVKNRSVSVICMNKKDGKHLAAQKMLQQLHPHIKSWGQMLALYGSRSMLDQKTKKVKEKEVTGLQTRNSSRPAPNLAILEKLKLEMRALAKYRIEKGTDAAASKEPGLGKFVSQLDENTITISNTCLEKVDL